MRHRVEPGGPGLIIGGGVDSAQGRQYDISSDGRFLINAELDASTAPIPLLMNWQPEAK